MNSTNVTGYTVPALAGVRDAFARAVADDTGTGAALSIWHDGEEVASLVGGVADRRDGRPWTPDTPSVVFSCTKGLMSVLVARLVQDGAVDYDTRVVDFWPEFGAAGKDAATVADLVSHRGGLPAPRRDWTPADILDWTRATSLLAEEAPLFAPGSAWAYHAITHGWLTGEIVRRITGRSAGEHFAGLVAAPLGVDAWIGLPAERRGTVAHMTVGTTLAELAAEERAQHDDGTSVWPHRALTLGGALPVGLVGEDVGFNRDDVQAAEIPGAGGIASARALAKIWSATVTETDGVRLLDEDTVARATAVRSEGAPFFPVPGPWPRWGMGFQLDSEARRYLGASSFGHDGAGGQVAFADTASGIGFAFLTNRMEAVDRRATEIIDALRTALTS